jgi:hypothetical protein
MQTWQCKVSVNGIPYLMETRAPNYVAAKGYFVQFGKLLNDPQIVNEKN